MTTHVGLVLDMSGSMGRAVNDTKGSVENYLKRVKEELDEALLTFTIFDTVFETWIDNKPLKEVKPNALLEKYSPRGATALYDAVANTIKKLKKNVDAYDKAIVVIITDGEENSSVEYDRKKLNKLVNKLQKNGNWTFVYLGANVDAWDEAQKIGIYSGNVGSYTYGRGQHSSSDSLARGTVAVASSGASSTSTFYGDIGEDGNFEYDSYGNKKTINTKKEEIDASS